MNWRNWFKDSGEDERYQAFKARFLQEQHEERVKQAMREERRHREIMEEIDQLGQG